MGENFLSTKLWSTWLVIILAYGLVFAGKLEAKAWMDMATVAVGIYATSNTISKAIRSKS